MEYAMKNAMEKWRGLFPEIAEIQDEELREKVWQTCEEALRLSGMTMEQLLRMPFTLLIPGVEVTYIEHVQAVVRMTVSAHEDFCRSYKKERYPLNKDYLIAGAILHDVGKILEYRCEEDGSFVTSSVGRNLRHPFSGVGLAMKHELPYEVCHIIAVHAGEGNGRYRSPEAVLVNRIDDMNFVILKAFQGMI